MTNFIFTPFESEIVGADKRNVYLQERYLDSNESSYCVLKIPRPIFNKAAKIWLNTKADYCIRFGHFCGVSGYFSVNEYKQIGEIDILIEIDENDKAIYKYVPLIKVVSINELCDMEHG